MSRYPFDHENDGDAVDANEYIYSDDHYGPSMHEADQVELWRLFEYSRMEFSGEQIAQLLEWNVPVADVRKLMERNSVRTECTHKQAMEILAPVAV